jgi:hypothetical protein
MIEIEPIFSYSKFGLHHVIGSQIEENFLSFFTNPQYQCITSLRKTQRHQRIMITIALKSQISNFKELTPRLFNSKLHHLPYNKLISLVTFSMRKTCSDARGLKNREGDFSKVTGWILFNTN